MRQFSRPLALIVAVSHFAAPAGTIAFVNRENSVNHIYFMEVDVSGAGSNAVRLTNDADQEDYPSWYISAHSTEPRFMSSTRTGPASSVYPRRQGST